jgi:hypothetical protein
VNVAHRTEGIPQRTRRTGVRVRESRLTIALSALRLAACHGMLVKSTRLRRA